MGSSTNTCLKLSENQKDQMEGLITENELSKHLKKIKNNVAPGNMGFPNKFFKVCRALK